MPSWKNNVCAPSSVRFRSLCCFCPLLVHPEDDSKVTLSTFCAFRLWKLLLGNFFYCCNVRGPTRSIDFKFSFFISSEAWIIVSSWSGYFSFDCNCYRRYRYLIYRLSFHPAYSMIDFLVSRLHVKITDSMNARWEVPNWIINRPSGPGIVALNQCDLQFSYTNKPFSFAITRGTLSHFGAFQFLIVSF